MLRYRYLFFCCFVKENRNLFPGYVLFLQTRSLIPPNQNMQISLCKVTIQFCLPKTRDWRLYSTIHESASQTTNVPFFVNWLTSLFYLTAGTLSLSLSRGFLQFYNPSNRFCVNVLIIRCNALDSEYILLLSLRDIVFATLSKIRKCLI